MVTLNINGTETTLDVDERMPLLWVLRDRMDLVGTKFGCGKAQCGACTVHIDGEAARSCSIRVGDAAGKRVTTIEGVTGKVAQAVQKAWQDIDVVQCGYCQSGQIMSAIVLLAAKPSPTDADIDSALAGNVCRCGTYVRIRKAIHQAAKELT
jgi:isoquinoline 1-oxidoreductase alpha subunit